MAYAIVDIETTGGHASNNGITEVSIHIHDGKFVIQQYETLINPGQQIPYYIRGLTGITDAMVAKAPKFSEVAEKIFSLLDGNIFIAHNVNFDYSFLKHQLAECGYQLNSKKLCTIRLSRKIFPGYPSYSLGNICGSLGITIENRHRAGGDTAATVKLLELLMQNDSEGIIGKFLKRNSKEQVLPPNLPKEHFEQLPHNAGVYYFHNQKGKIIYVGKAKDIKKRVSSHFSNNSPNKQKQDFLRSIHSISHEVCGNELMALILESHQIKHLWPQYNRSQKRFEPVYGILEYYDQLGFRRLGLGKVNKGNKPLAAISNLTDGYSLVRQLTVEFELCPRLTGIATDVNTCLDKKCDCTKKNEKSIAGYNQRVELAIQGLLKSESYVIIEKGRKENEIGMVVVDNGSFKRMGYIPESNFSKTNLSPGSFETLPLYRENFNIRQIITGYRNNYPENVVILEQNHL